MEFREDLMIPSDDQIAELVRQRMHHAEHCDQHPVYDVSCKGKIRMSCRCGWEFVVEPESNTTDL